MNYETLFTEKEITLIAFAPAIAANGIAMVDGTISEEETLAISAHLLDATERYRHNKLIMLAIQVNSPSPEAIKIIIPKAIRAGASRDEIIDTLILTIPVVGLSTVMKMLPFVLKELESFEKAYGEVR